MSDRYVTVQFVLNHEDDGMDYLYRGPEKMIRVLSPEEYDHYKDHIAAGLFHALPAECRAELVRTFVRLDEPQPQTTKGAP